MTEENIDADNLKYKISFTISRLRLSPKEFREIIGMDEKMLSGIQSGTVTELPLSFAMCIKYCFRINPEYWEKGGIAKRDLSENVLGLAYLNPEEAELIEKFRAQSQITKNKINELVDIIIR